jgi:metalloendopeptidase OMA1, mitochondrial
MYYFTLKKFFSGVVCVSTGILPVCQDEQGLAAVLGHGIFFYLRDRFPLLTIASLEIGHVALRHVAEKYSSSTVLMSALVFLQLLGLDFFVASSIGTLLYTLPNSRAMEREADIVGLRMMAKACYNPKAAPE